MTYPFTHTYHFCGFTYAGDEYLGAYDVNQDGEVESPRICLNRANEIGDDPDDLPDEVQGEVAEAHWAKHHKEMTED